MNKKILYLEEKYQENDFPVFLVDKVKLAIEEVAIFFGEWTIR
ncbi:hypothetical protein ACWOFR_05025 [Carnobacterium gallinarum]|nr:hypothetical protein [Carnobacterium gallinarum]